MARPHCKSPDACAAKGAGHCRSCHMAAAVKANWRDPEFRERQAAATKAYFEKKKVQIPSWVPASLHEEFSEIARSQGEEAAASLCRRLKRGMAS